MIDNKWLTIQEAAKLSGCSTGYLRDLLGQKKLVGVKAGERAWLVERESITQLAKKKPGVGRPRGNSKKKS